MDTDVVHMLGDLFPMFSLAALYSTLLPAGNFVRNLVVTDESSSSLEPCY